MERSMLGRLEDLYQSLESSENGLATSVAERHLIEYGPNETIEKDRFPILKDILFFCANPLVIILLLAAAVSGSLGGMVDATIIVVMVGLSVILNVLQTYRSRVAVSELQSRMSPTATVIRGGQTQEIARRLVVPGDIVRLAAGDLVPADCRLVSAVDLHVQQSALTGESLPVDKRASADQLAEPEDADSAACVFLGTSVVSGVATALVVKTGKDTIFGDIARRLSTKPPETEFEGGIRKFGILILKTVVFLVFFVFLSAIVLKRNPLESLLFSVALAVGLTPEFLPMITTVTLSRGAVFMAKRGVIVKNLASIQNFGSMDILCSDKTGTLTSGQMTLEKVVGPFGEPNPEVVRYARINSSLQTGIHSPLDEIILIQPTVPPPATKLGETPFDFERRRMSVIAAISGDNVLICKGAPEGILDNCVNVIENQRAVALTDSLRVQTKQTFDSLSRAGYRLLAVATRTIDARSRYTTADERDLTLLGYLGFVDSALPDALNTLEDLRKTGLSVKIISGDNPLVTEHVCRQVGLEPGQILLGSEIDRVSDIDLQHLAEERTVFSRVSPSQKNRIILALKARGHVVGYMGDGINDAPSLHAADVGISVSSAVDVAKDAADIILVKPGLSVLKDGVLQGRMAFGNVMKYILMGTSSNFGNMFSMAGATLFLPFLPMLPTQILLNNFLYDLSQITIPGDAVDATYIEKPRRWNVDLIRKFMLVIGPISSIFDFTTFFVLLRFFRAPESEFHTGWFVESLATQVLVIFVIRTMGSPFASRPSPALSITALAIALFACVIPYTPIAVWMNFVPLPAGYFLFLVPATALYLFVVERVKRMLFGRPA